MLCGKPPNADITAPAQMTANIQHQILLKKRKCYKIIIFETLHSSHEFRKILKPV
jgi:hypothetical protein